MWLITNLTTWILMDCKFKLLRTVLFLKISRGKIGYWFWHFRAQWKICIWSSWKHILHILTEFRIWDIGQSRFDCWRGISQRQEESKWCCKSHYGLIRPCNVCFVKTFNQEYYSHLIYTLNANSVEEMKYCIIMIYMFISKLQYAVLCFWFFFGYNYLHDIDWCVNIADD